MNILIVGFGGKLNLAINSILTNLIELSLKKEDEINFYLFGYSENNEKEHINERVIANTIKDPFLCSKFNRFRIKRKLCKILKIDSGLISWEYLFKKLNRTYADKHFDLVISASGKFCYTQAAYIYAKKNNFNFAIIYFDPFTNGINAINKRKRLEIEKRWYKKAKFIFYDADGAYLPFEDVDTKARPFFIPIFEKETRFNLSGPIIYGGSFYPGFRDVSLLTNFLNKINDSEDEFVIYSNLPSKKDMNVEFKAPISYAEFEKECKRCKAYIVIGNGENSKTIPSKILEGISYKKPIIGINISKSIDQLNKYPLYFDGDSNDVIQRINNLSKDDVLSLDIYSIFPERDPSILVNNFLNLIKTL